MMQEEELEERGFSPSVVQENARLRLQLSKCQDDKEFVWMLWKDLQKENPDLTSAVDMIVTREELRNEQKIRELTQTVKDKTNEALALEKVVEGKVQEAMEKDEKLEKLSEEVTKLQGKLEILELEKQKQTREEHMKRQKMRETCSKLELELDNERKTLFIHHEEGPNYLRFQHNITEMKRMMASYEEHIQQNEELTIDNERKEAKIKLLEKEVCHVNGSIEEVSRVREELEMNLKNQQAELLSVRRELEELRQSRDAWANHTTLQSTAVQQLQQENASLKEKLSELRAREQRETERAVQTTPKTKQKNREFVEEKKTEKVVLERVERELFQTQMELKAKTKELEGLRGFHERRAKRMQALQSSLVLLEKQLQTYDTLSECQSQTKGKVRVTAATKDLRRENSDAVWNELASYKDRCHSLESQMCEMEEERDSAKAKYLRSQSCVAELRRQLELRGNDLERTAVKAEKDSVSFSMKSHRLQTRVNELEGLVKKLKNEKTRVLSQLSCTEKELVRLQDEAAKMKTTIMDLDHNNELKNLKTCLSRGTMTDDKVDSCRNEQLLLSVTSSAVQVNLLPSEPELRDVAVSPIKPPPPSSQQSLHSLDASTQTNPPTTTPHPLQLIQTATVSTQTHGANERNLLVCKKLRTHQRTHSEGDSLFYRRKAKSALKRANKLSKTLRDFSIVGRSNGEGGAGLVCTSGKEGGEEVAPVITRSITCQCEAVEPQPAIHMPGDQKCMLQYQKVKTLQKKLRTATKQLGAVGTARQSLAQCLESEKRINGRARTEIRELNLRLQGMKTVVQSLQGEVHRLHDTNQQLNQRLTDLSELRKGKSETDWKRLESEKKGLSEKCVVLNETVKSLEDSLKQKTSQLYEEHEKYVRAERDARHKRQLLESQRDKTKTIVQQAEEDKAKLVHYERETNKLKSFLEQSRQKIATKEVQLSRLKEEKAKTLQLLASCQQELSDMVGRLAKSHETNQEYRQLHEERIQQLKLSSKHELQKLSQQNTAKLELVQQRHEERERLLKDELKNDKLSLREYRLFVQVLAERVTQRSSKPNKLETNDDRNGTTSAVEISCRVREIARSTLNLSDLEIEDLFSIDYERKQEKSAELFENLEDLLSKFPFARVLADRFMTLFS